MNGAQPSIFANNRRGQKQWVGHLPPGLESPDPTHRDGAAMNGAQPSIFANNRRRQKHWVGHPAAALWLGDFIHLQCNSGLREQPAVDGCVSLYGDQCLAQDDALEV